MRQIVGSLAFGNDAAAHPSFIINDGLIVIEADIIVDEQAILRAYHSNPILVQRLEVVATESSRILLAYPAPNLLLEVCIIQVLGGKAHRGALPLQFEFVTVAGGTVIRAVGQVL